MANALGYVSETQSGFEGSLAMLNLVVAIRIEANADKDLEGQPHYRIFAGDTSTEIGGGWMRKANASDDPAPDPGRSFGDSVRLSFWLGVGGQGPLSGAFA